MRRTSNCMYTPVATVPPVFKFSLGLNLQHDKNFLAIRGFLVDFRTRRGRSGAAGSCPVRRYCPGFGLCQRAEMMVLGVMVMSKSSTSLSRMPSSL